MYILYSGPLTVGLAPQMVLEELQLPYQLHTVDIFKNEHRSHEYLKINPAGWVPALVTPEGQILHEAPAIMLYLADRHGPPQLAPDLDDPLRGDFYAKLFYLANDMQPVMKRYYYPHRYSTDPADTPQVKEQALITARDRWRVLDEYLQSDGPFLLGERLSVADIYMAFYAGSGFDPPLNLLGEFPAVRVNFDLLLTRPRIAPLLRSCQSEKADHVEANSVDSTP